MNIVQQILLSQLQIFIQCLLISGGIAPEEMHIFFQEIELMKRVSITGNIHIVQIIGCILNEPPIAMVMEYVPFGDLHSNLVQWKEQVFNYSL